MKILLLTQVLPYPPDSGPKVKTWNVIQYLTQRHDVTLVSFVRGDQSKEVRYLEQYCKAVHTVSIRRTLLGDLWFMGRSLLNGQPFLMLRDERIEMQRLVDRLAAEQQFDVAHADQLNMAQYASRLPQARKVLDAHNALWLLYHRLWQTMSPGPKKWLLGRDWRLLKDYEGRVCRDFDAVVAVSQEDEAALEEAAGQPLNGMVIPIAVDTDSIQPVRRQPGAGHILHIGTMFWPPNIDGILWFLREILPLIRRSHPDIVFDVIGASPPKEIREYGDQDAHINVTGYVDNPRPYLEQTGVMVVPLRAGGGMRVKILNAMAQGLPVVSTTLGCEGISVTPGEHLLVADSPEAFARAVVCLLEHPERAAELGQKGRQLVEAVYDYRSALKPLDHVYGLVEQAAGGQNA